MKKLIYTIVFALIATATISSCTEQNIKPQDGGSNDQPCQFNATGCPPK